MTGELMHTASKERNGAVHLSYYHMKSEVPIALHYQLYSTHYKSKTVRKAPLQSKYSSKENYEKYDGDDNGDIFHHL